MNKLPLDKSVTRQQAMDLLNYIHSLIERYLRSNQEELNILHRTIFCSREIYVRKKIKVRINNLHEKVINDLKRAYADTLKECEERQNRINLLLTQNSNKIPPGFPDSPVTNLSNCINIFHHNFMLTQYEMELYNLLTLNQLRESHFSDKTIETPSTNITYLFDRNN